MASRENEKDVSVPLDRTGQMLLAELHRLLDTEPQEPNGNMPLSTQDETAKAHAHWSSQVSAFRLLLGVRLVNAALSIPPGSGCSDG